MRFTFAKKTPSFVANGALGPKANAPTPWNFLNGLRKIRRPGSFPQVSG
jgi:hypothetical protein